MKRQPQTSLHDFHSIGQIMLLSMAQHRQHHITTIHPREWIPTRRRSGKNLKSFVRPRRHPACVRGNAGECKQHVFLQSTHDKFCDIHSYARGGIQRAGGGMRGNANNTFVSNQHMVNYAIFIRAPEEAPSMRTGECGEMANNTFVSNQTHRKLCDIQINTSGCRYHHS